MRATFGLLILLAVAVVIEIAAGTAMTLTYSVTDGSMNGLPLSGVQVTGQDGARNRLEGTTDSYGLVDLNGQPGIWNLTFAKNGYETRNDSTDFAPDDVYVTTYLQRSASNPAPVIVWEDINYLPWETYDRNGNSITGSILGCTRAASVDPVVSADLSGVPPLNASPSFLLKYFTREVEPNNPLVREKAAEIAGKTSGSYTIDQICAIYEYLHNGWHYVKGGMGYANETLRLGEKDGCSGVGDCGDFAIVLASMIETIGGSARIVATIPDSGDVGHAYAEVYVGKNDADLSHAFELLCKRYKTGNTNTSKVGSPAFKMFFHRNSKLNDCWLNLDWSASHPGGPFMKGSDSVIVWESQLRNLPDQPSTARY